LDPGRRRGASHSGTTVGCARAPATLTPILRSGGRQCREILRSSGRLPRSDEVGRLSDHAAAMFIRLFTAAQGIDTCLTSALLSVTLPPSFWMTLPVSVSQFFSTNRTKL